MTICSATKKKNISEQSDVKPLVCRKSSSLIYRFALGTNECGTYVYTISGNVFEMIFFYLKEILAIE